MLIEKRSIQNVLCIRLSPGDDIKASLEKAVKEQHIQNAVILSGVGSVNSHHYHVVATRVNPPLENFTKGDAAADIINMSGAILNGKVHAHITYANEKVAYGGHLELGSEVLSFAIITLAEIDLDLGGWDTIVEM